MNKYTIGGENYEWINNDDSSFDLYRGGSLIASFTIATDWNEFVNRLRKQGIVKLGFLKNAN